MESLPKKTRKEALLYKMLHPKKEGRFTEQDFLELVHLKDDEAVTFDDLRGNIRQIYDMNENSLLTESNAMGGSLAWLNRKKQDLRRKKFFSRIRDGKRTKDYKTIVAEGDSWFCFPLYVKDINEWLIEDEAINLYSIAAAGDWLTNIIYEGKYVEELSLVEPDVFLISGGGNDFCGSNRLAFMINTNVDEELTGDEFCKVCISDAFEAFMWTLQTQYWILLSSLNRSEKLKELKVITQGYDYVIPFPKVRRGPDMIQWIINKATATGDWLRTPLMLKGLRKIESHIAVTAYFIDKVNEMFIKLANYKEPSGDYKFPNLYHVDCRGVAGGFEGWFDEIHLKSDKFEIVANAYKHIILKTRLGREPFNPKQKVVKAVWFDPEGSGPPTSKEKQLLPEQANMTR
ncbi:MAG TPA: hypothetical protein VEY10_16500 [Flavisolibacter sp.]|jgi:hypothetical protein|nr:hypothetical protein [Flavisolibacter sp.]